MGHRPKKELKKPKTAEDKGKRYRCCICRKRAPRKTKVVPYYCDEHANQNRTTEAVDLTDHFLSVSDSVASFEADRD